MTKIYLVQSCRVKKNGEVYTVVENVFTNRKKADGYVKWLTEGLKVRNKWYEENKLGFWVHRYYHTTLSIDNTDYSKRPY